MRVYTIKLLKIKVVGFGVFFKPLIKMAGILIYLLANNNTLFFHCEKRIFFHFPLGNISSCKELFDSTSD